MFAVPGWSVSADKLKAETAAASAGGTPAAAKSKKRKLPVDVTPANVADFWEKFIERKGQPASATVDERRLAKKAKRNRRKHDVASSRADQGSEEDKEHRRQPAAEDPKDESPKVRESDPSAKKKPKKESREGKRVKNDAKAATLPAKDDQRRSIKNTNQQAELAPPAPPKPAKLTALQASMREKLVSARFRHLNETLYTRPSADALRLFADSPDMFDEYHEGFRRQVGVWPENPVDGYIRDVLSRGRLRPAHHKGGTTASVAPPPQQPLPRTDGTCAIADLGCGDAALAAALQPHLQKLHLSVLSYDLHSASALVTRTDIASLPLRDGSVDVAIFCLALMGTNWLDFVEEAYRVLRWRGELWVAEIKSRFAGAAKAARRGQPVDHSVGNRKKGLASGGLKARSKARDAAAADEAADEADLAVEVDGEDKRRETNVSAFVEALRRRGFVLRGEGAAGIDASNKMFVKMAFIKAAPAVKGKAVARMKDAGQGAGKKKRFIPTAEEEEQADGANEAAILKPCVYKLR